MMKASCNGSSNQDGSYLNNQADFLPTSSQSPGHSPQPSPDSQQKDLGVSAPQQLAHHPIKSRAVLQHNHQLSPRRGQQQDQHVSQSSGLTQQYQPRPLAPPGHEGHPHMQGAGGGNLNNMTGMTQPAFQQRNVSSSQQTFPHGSTQSKPPLTHFNQHYQKQQHPLQRPPLQQHPQIVPRPQQQQQRMPTNSFPRISNPAAVDSGQHSQANQRLPQLRFSSHQPRFQTQQQPRFSQVPGPGAHNRSQPPFQPQQPQLTKQHSSPALMPAATNNRSQRQQGMIAQNRATGPVLGSHPGMVQSGHEMYSEQYNEDENYMEEGEMYPEEYEGEEEEEDYDEDMEGDYNYSGVPYDDYMSSGSEDLSEEESNLFEELSQLDKNDPRYTEVFNRLRDKGVDVDEINEIVNPERHLYSRYGEEMEDYEDQIAGMGDNSSFNEMRMTKEASAPQAASNLHEASAMPIVSGTHHGPQAQNLNVHKTLMVPANRKQNPSVPSSSAVAPPAPQNQVRQQLQQKQAPVLLGFVSNPNQPRKVFQSPVPSPQSASGSGNWQQKGPESSVQHQPRLPSNAPGFSQQLRSPGKPRGPVRPQGPRLQRPQNPISQHGIPSGHMPRQSGAHQQVSSTGMPQQMSQTQPQQGIRSPALRPLVPGHRMPLMQRPPVPVQSKPGIRGMRPVGPRAVSMGPAMPISQACQSRLEVQQMQELLDKEIMAKKKVTGPSVTSSTSQPNQPVAEAPIRQAAPMLRQQLLQPRFPSPVMPPVRPHGISQVQQAPTAVVASPIAVRPRGTAPHVNQGFQQPLVVTQTRLASPAMVAIATPRPPPPPQAQFRSNVTGADSSAKLPHENLQAQQSRQPSFNVSALKEEKCKVISPDGKRQDLVRNKMYKIKSPIDQSMIYAKWNGEKFEDVSLSSAVVTQASTVPSVSTSQVTTTGQQPKSEDEALVSPKPRPKVSFTSASESAFQEQFLQTLGKSNKVKQASSSMEPDTNSNKEDSMMQTSGKETMPHSSKQTTYVKPLSQETVPRTKPGEEEDEDEEDDDDSIFKKPFSENEDVFRVCNNCGTTSKDFKTCDGCQKIFHGEMKIHCVKKGNAKEDKMLSQPSTSRGGSLSMQDMKPSDRFRQVMSKASTFYGNHGAPRGVRGAIASRRGMGRTRGGGLRGKLALEDEEGHPSSEEESEEKKGGKKRQGKPKAKTATPRKRSKKTDEPVTVTISSDEDEPSSTSNMFPGFASSPASSAGSGSPIFTTNQMNPINAFGRFRRLCMEDEEGNSKLNKKLKQTRREPAQPPPLEEDGEDEDEDEEEEDSDDPAVYQIDIRSIRIGSMRTQPEAPMLISLHGICFRCRAERTEEEFECEIMCQEVEHVKFYGGQPQPLLFLFLTLEGGEKLRSICHMETGGDEYFDPSSTDMKKKMIVIIIEPFNETPLEMMRENITLWADMNHQDENKFLQELNADAANDLLIQSAPPMLTTSDVERDFLKFKKRYITEEGERQILSAGVPGSPPEQADNEPDSTSSSPPDAKSHFYGPPIKLLRYPPPPASGISITTEDLMCLAEGEFLNDVVIDFYLQYLYKERLSEENQKRTHIFSSFFYKRLTQRDRHNERTEEESKKSLPERRHARVKKWTKTVDLFSKDFIIVPINEHSHWYLAVICFPGLANPEVVPYIPNPAHIADPEESQNDAAGSEDGASSKEEGKGSHETVLKRTVFGRHLTDGEDDKSDEGKLIGQKLPCILMFDSLAGPNRNTNVKMLREYLQCEWDAKKSEPRQITKIMRGTTPKVPQQSNFSDCGIFLLQYVESFFDDPIADFQVPMKGLQDWFHEELVFHKRREIHELIMGLHHLYMEERGDPNILDIPYDSTPMQPPSLHAMPGPSSQDHFLGQPEDYGDMSGMREDDNSNSSSAAWDNKTEQVGLFPVALRQNTMFEGEESNSCGLPSKVENTEEEEEEKSQVASAPIPDNKSETDAEQQDHQSSDSGEKAVMETSVSASSKDLLDAAEEKIDAEDKAKSDLQTDTHQNELKTPQIKTNASHSGDNKEQEESLETNEKDSPEDKSDSINAEQLKHGL